MDGLANLITQEDDEIFQTVGVRDGKMCTTYHCTEEGNNTVDEGTVQDHVLKFLNQIDSGSLSCRFLNLVGEGIY